MPAAAIETVAAVAPELGSIKDIVTNFGFAGMIFVVWLMDMRKAGKLEEVIKEQLEDKRSMADREKKYIEVIEDNARMTERVCSVLTRIEQKL